jgi:TIR domain
MSSSPRATRYREAIGKNVNGGSSVTGLVRAWLFLSWCHQDAEAKEALLSLLHLEGLAGVRISWWEDPHLLLGEDWRRRILARLDGCDYGLLLLSPGFFSSRFILDEELPRLFGPGVDKVLPVMLKRVPMDGSWDLHGVDARQIFLGPGGRCFTETRGAGRERFALDLATKIRERVLGDAA